MSSVVTKYVSHITNTPVSKLSVNQ